MSNMDDVYERMTDFTRALEKFQESLEASSADLRKHHEVVAPLWTDESRRAYDAIYSALEETLHRHVQRQGPMYHQFLTQRLHRLHNYLFGD